MANTKTSTTLFEGNNKIILQYSVEYSDTADESDIAILDISGMTGPDGVNVPDKLKIEEVAWMVPDAAKATLEWDYGTDKLAIHMQGTDEVSYVHSGPLYVSGSGGTGDILLSYESMGTDDTLTVLIKAKKSQANKVV